MDVFVKFLIGFLLLFTPFAFAGTEPWGFSVVQGVLIVAWSCALFSRKTLYKTTLFKPVFYTMSILIVLALVQVLFPQTTLQPVPFWHPVTLMRLYTLDHISLFITYLALAGLVMQFYPSQQEVKHLLEWSVICALLVALIAVSFPKGEYIFRLAGLRAGIGPFLNRNHASLYFALNALVALGLFFTKGLESGRNVFSSKQRHMFIVQQTSLAVIFVALVIATVMTRSRGGMLSLLTGLFAYSFLCVYAIPTQLKKRLKGFFITLAVLILTTGWIVTHTQEINAFAQRGTNASEETRKMLYRSAGYILKERPIWGIGIGAMPVVITSYVEWPVNGYIERLHNDWLEILLGVGYLGAVFILLGLIWFIGRALYLLKRLEIRKQLFFAALLSALVAMGIGSLFDFHFFIPANAVLFFVLLGAATAPTYAKKRVLRVHVKIWHRAVILLVLAAAFYVPLQKTLAWRNSLFGKGYKTQAKLMAYERALSQYPSPRYAFRLGAAYLQASKRASSIQEQEELRAKAYRLITDYLTKYPKEKALSRLYVYVRPRIGKEH